MLIHHVRERQHDQPHHFFGEKVWEFFESRPYKSEDAAIERALRQFHAIFAPFGLVHVSIFRIDGEYLKIHGHEVYPSEADRGYFEPLRPGQGVAGLVYVDMNPRYVPRLFFPWNRSSALSAFFPHSMKFEIATDDDGTVTLVNPNMDLYVFEPPQQGTLRYKAFLSVPLKCAQGSKTTDCLGVLNFDFDRTDPLTKMDIKSAVFLGALLGDEIDRARGHH